MCVTFAGYGGETRYNIAPIALNILDPACKFFPLLNFMLPVIKWTCRACYKYCIQRAVDDKLQALS